MKADFNYSKNSKRSILIVDDEEINRELLGFILKDRYDIEYAANGLEALEAVREDPARFSLILLDILMPKMNGFEFIENIKADMILKSIPIIVLTSEADAEVKSLHLGAADFIKKPYDLPEIILARVNRIIELSEDKNIIRSAERDLLTDLYTKEFFFEYSRRMNRFYRSKEMDGAVISIDQFGLIKELYGADGANAVIRCAAEEIKKAADEKDGIGCRADDNLFYLYCRHSDNYDKLINNIKINLNSIPDTESIRIKIGVFPDIGNGKNIDKGFDKARAALGTLKNDFTKNIAYYNDELYERDMLSERLMRDMQTSIDNKDFKVYFQPKYRISGDKPVLSSAEALVRWIHPEMGMIGPGAFIPLFEENGLIYKLDHYVWQETGKRIREWKDKFGVMIPVSVNVSRVDIFDPKIIPRLLAIVEENGLETRDLILEVTESSYAKDSKSIIKVVEELRSFGFIIEMDDFGSGYSSLNMLNDMPIDILKLDMDFVKNVHKDKKSRRLVELIMDIAKYLSVPVVAEGVEYEEQYIILKDMGCEIIQGYYFSPPLPAEGFEKIIEENK